MTQEQIAKSFLPNPERIVGKEEYKNNPRLRPAGVTFAYTKEHIEEYAKCAHPETGLEYFLSKYIKVEHPDGKVVAFEPYIYQTDFAKKSIKNRYILIKLARQSGKCVHENTRVKVLNELDNTINEILIKDLYLHIDKVANQTNTIVNEEEPDKFIESYSVFKKLRVLSDKGWVQIKYLHKTKKYEEYLLKTESHSLTCADNHLVFLPTGKTVFVKDLKLGDEIMTENGKETVFSVTKTGKSSHMFDLTVDSREQRYYTNGILSHNTTVVAAVILWHVLFQRRCNVAITANKLIQAIEILERIKLSIEWLPIWMQQGITQWRATKIGFENHSRIVAAATSMSGVRGQSYSIVYMDEFSHIHPNTQKKFFESVYPAISAGKKTKLFISTTPNGLDMFYKMWVDSENGMNDFVRVDSHWSDKPGRDQAWADAEIARIGEDSFAQEYGAEFLGSSATLINGRILATIPIMKPISKSVVGMKVFEEPVKGHTYVCTVDVSRGLGLDYQASVVVDVTSVPYKVVASYRNNKLPPSLLHEIVFNLGTHYNNAMVMVETNDVGLRVAEDLLQIDEYENVLMTQVKGKSGTRLGGGFGANSRYGMKTTVQTKKIGCTVLKQLIERNHLEIRDEEILWELSRFVGKGGKYQAEEGSHDDLVMCLVLFAWVTDQKFFKESVETDFRTALVASGGDEWDESDLMPFGIIDDGQEEALDQQSIWS